MAAIGPYSKAFFGKFEKLPRVKQEDGSFRVYPGPIMPQVRLESLQRIHDCLSQPGVWLQVLSNAGLKRRDSHLLHAVRIRGEEGRTLGELQVQFAELFGDTDAVDASVQRLLDTKRVVEVDGRFRVTFKGRLIVPHEE